MGSLSLNLKLKGQLAHDALTDQRGHERVRTPESGSSTLVKWQQFRRRDRRVQYMTRVPRETTSLLGEFGYAGCIGTNDDERGVSPY
jgi:hypothetical protein